MRKTKIERDVERIQREREAERERQQREQNELQALYERLLRGDILGSLESGKLLKDLAERVDDLEQKDGWM